MKNEINIVGERKYYFVHLYNDFSGSPRVLREMVEILPGNRHVITSNTNGILSGINDVKYSHFNYLPASNLVVKLLAYLIANMKIFFILLRLLRENKRDSNYVIVNTMLPFGAMLASKITKSTLTSYVHETSIKPFILKKFLRKIIELCADNVVFVSKFLYEKEFFKQISKQQVIYNPLSPHLISESKDIDFLAKFNDRNVIFISSLLECKGVKDFIQIAELSFSANDNIVFTLVLNCTEKQLHDFLKDTPLPENIVLFRRPADLRRLYLSSAIVLNLTNPNQWLETFGLTLAEGMANGSIPIGPELGGPVELIDETCGFNIIHSDHASIRNKILYVLSDVEIFEFYAKNAKAKSEVFSLEVYKDRILNFIDNSL
ncbi:Glycosyl transferases group 1 [compost metagenome]|uniref:Glycosyltransferase family 4 protein n=1 Tax=Silvania hatchlandensis TaxID=2926469 RepID=A0A9J6Q4N9_9ENTR|nr:glycosyltransferase family 4 protein [Silvania hatchlandensis]MCU6664558.1 glycosyltransferase family 4 protein [Silvania hatchlandensis]